MYIRIMGKTDIDGYIAGEAAYDAWADYISADAWEDMDDDFLKNYYGFHHGFVGNYTEIRCYLGNFLYSKAASDENLQKAAGCINEIHDTCRQIWGAAASAPRSDTSACGIKRSVASLRRLSAK